MDLFRVTRLTFAALLIASPIAAAGGDLSAVFNGRSYHVDATQDWNENNFGLGLEYQFETRSHWKKRLMVNGFRDSSGEMSYMAGGALHRNLLATDRFNGFYVDVGINAFLMTRRDVNGNRPFPGALPSLSIGNRDMGFNLTYLPMKAVESFVAADMKDDTLSGIVFLQFKIDASRLFPGD